MYNKIFNQDFQCFLILLLTANDYMVVAVTLPTGDFVEPIPVHPFLTIPSPIIVNNNVSSSSGGNNGGGFILSTLSVYLFYTVSVCK